MVTHSTNLWPSVTVDKSTGVSFVVYVNRYVAGEHVYTAVSLDGHQVADYSELPSTQLQQLVVCAWTLATTNVVDYADGVGCGEPVVQNYLSTIVGL